MPVIPLQRLTELLAANLEEKPELALLIYAPFGIVRGMLVPKSDSADTLSSTDHVTILLNDVTVEHYSNHIPTATYQQLSIRLQDVQACAILD